MKTPRALLAVALALAASVARAGDPTTIFLPQNNRGVADFSRPQNAADWKILHIERNPSDVSLIRLAPRGTAKGDPITLVNPYDEYFIVPAGSVMFGGMATVLSVSKDPYPGAMRGEPVRLLGSGGQPTGPQLWLPSHNSADITDQLRYWPTMPADNTRVDRPRVIVLPRERSLADNGLQSGGLPNWFTLPGQKPRDVLSPLLGGQDLSSTLLGFPGQAGAPPTYYTALTNYRYDERNKRLIGPDGSAKTVTVMAMPAGTFYLAPPAIPHDIRIPGVTLVNSSGAKVDPKKGAQPPKSDGRRSHEFKKVAWAGNWKDKVTHIHRWHAVETTQAPIPMAPTPMMTFYCYHEKEDGHKNISGHLKSNYDIIECVDWIVPADDKVEKADGKEYRVRNNRVVIDVVYKDHALRRVDAGGANLVLKDKPLSHAAIGGQDYVKVTAAPAAPVAGALLLSAKELIWLDRRQGREYAAEKAAAEAKPAAEKAAAAKALAEKYRKLVVENLAPNTAASGAYTAAAADAKATSETIDKTLPAQVWGGPNEAIVENFGPRTEIQLSKADWDALNANDAAGKPKYAEALETYTRERTPSNGKVGQAPEYRKELYDPIVLHRLAEAARKAVGSSEGKPPVPTNPTGDALLALLTDDEKKFLTPIELENYERILDSAPAPKEKDQSVQAELRKLRPRIKEREGKPYPKEGLTEKTFDAAPDWQKDKFCTPAKIGGAIAASGPKTNETVLNAGGDAAANLTDAEKKARADLAAQQAAAGTAQLPAWAIEKCKGKPFFKEPAPSKPTDTNLAVDGPIGGGSTAKKATGVDVENKEKEKSKWLTQDLLTSAAKGAMVGLLVGSLFGPVGLIAGPLLGGALFYGLTKITS